MSPASLRAVLIGIAIDESREARLCCGVRLIREIKAVLGDHRLAALMALLAAKVALSRIANSLLPTVLYCSYVVACASTWFNVAWLVNILPSGPRTRKFPDEKLGVEPVS